MKTFKFTFCVLLFLFSVAHAGMVDLPEGGKIFVDTNVWNVQKTPFVKKDALMFLHRKDKALIGYQMDGSIRSEAYCGKNTSKKWITCEKDFPLENKQVSRQFVLQKHINGENYQNYIFVFNFAPERLKELEPLFKSFRQNMEKNK